MVRLKYARLLYLSLVVAMSLVVKGQSDENSVMISDLAWSSTSKYLAIATTKGVLLYDTEDNLLVRLQNCSSSNISNIAFTPDDSILAYSMSDTSSVFLFSLEKFQVTSEIQIASERISALEFRDENFLGIGGFDYAPDRMTRGNSGLYFIRIDEGVSDVITSREVFDIYDISFYENYVFASMMPSGLSRNFGDILIYDLEADTLELGSYRRYVSIPPSLFGNLTIIPMVDEYYAGQLSLVNLSTGEQLLEDNFDTGFVTAIDLSPDRAFYADNMGNIYILDVSTGERNILDQGNAGTVKLLEASDILLAVVRSTEMDDTLEIWDIEDNARLVEVEISAVIE